MIDLEAIAYFVNEGEHFASARWASGKLKLYHRDVYHIRVLGAPTGGNIDFFYRVWAHTNKRLIVSRVEDACTWVQYFNRVGTEFMEVDDHTFIFDKEL